MVSSCPLPRVVALSSSWPSCHCYVWLGCYSPSLPILHNDGATVFVCLFVYLSCYYHAATSLETCWIYCNKKMNLPNIYISWAVTNRIYIAHIHVSSHPTESLKHFFILNNQASHLNIYAHMYVVFHHTHGAVSFVLGCSINHLIWSLSAFMYICALCTIHDMHLHPQLMLVLFYFQGCLPTPAVLFLGWWNPKYLATVRYSFNTHFISL